MRGLRRHCMNTRCLDELVDIMYCFHEFDQRKVLPVFFNVEPSYVRNQQGSFKEAFEVHETNFDPDRVQKWRQALKDAGQLSGHHLQNRDEEGFIYQIVEQLQNMQIPQVLFVTDHPVGIGSRVEELISKLRLGCKNVSIVAVLGISGIGKTTIAKATYNRIVAEFDMSCFFADIHYHCQSPNWKVHLQTELLSCLSQNDKFRVMHSHNDGVTKIRKLLSHRKVLLVLDDVENFQQLKALGIHPACFHDGSRIIVTTADKRSLGSLPYIPYDTSLLNRRESLELFTRLTFEKDDRVDKKFVIEVVTLAAGLPLVLEVWSRHFKHHKRNQWPSVLETLKRIPHGDVQKQLQLSYDSLTNRVKKLFLDLACFFVRMDKDLIVKVLQDEDSAFFPDNEISDLVDKGLVVMDGSFRMLMHHAIRQMGIEIVRQENEDEPGQRTRLEDKRDVIHVLTECSGTESVETIKLLSSEKEAPLQVEAFRKMSNLRLIMLYGLDLPWISSNDDMPPFCFKKLKYLEWHGFPLKYINIDMINVMVIRLHNSKLETLWEGTKSLKKLRILDVSFSVSLTKTGDFYGLENLEELRFYDCKNLKELHTSVGKLRSLQQLKLNGCPNIGLEHDEVIDHLLLSLKDCRITLLELGRCNISKISSELGSLTCLKHLDLSGNRFPSLPDSLVQLHELEVLNLSKCDNLQSIPNLPLNLGTVISSNCTSLVNLPSNMSALKLLSELRLDGCSKLGSEDPECLMKLTGLTNICQLTMENCNISHVPKEIGNLVSLWALELSRNTFSSLPDSLSNLSQLSQLMINDCGQLRSLPLLPSNLKKIEALRCWSLDLTSFDSMQTTCNLYTEVCKESPFSYSLDGDIILGYEYDYDDDCAFLNKDDEDEM